MTEVGTGKWWGGGPARLACECESGGEIESDTCIWEKDPKSGKDGGTKRRGEIDEERVAWDIELRHLYSSKNV